MIVVVAQLVNVIVSTRTSARRRSPIAVVTTIGLLWVLGVSAGAGGVELTFGIWGVESFPPDWLDRSPFVDSWLIPGLVLGVGFGLGSLVMADGLLRRPRVRWLGFVERWTGRHWAWLGTVLIGAGHIVWIALEVAYIPGFSWLEAVYGGIGVALLLLPWTPSVRRYLLITA